MRHLGEILSTDDALIRPKPSFRFPVAYVGGIPFAIADLASAVAWLQTAALRGDSISVRLANAYCVSLAEKDRTYRAVLTDSGVNFPDGTPVVWFMRRHRVAGEATKAQRVRGPSMFMESMSASESSGTSNFLLGTTANTLGLLIARLRRKFPSAAIVGSYAPPFAPISETFLEDCCERIIASKADIVWIGLGTPKQDFVAKELAQRTGRPCVGVGAAFDFAAGTVAEAPKWIQNSGFEWAYRFMSDPRRLWRRYLIGNAHFVSTALAYGSGATR
jgi:N-acetylglucosaminyldiphosphoundecaprenol N-acetyl-beta-D-mannosaminyltransferase